ncbi:tubulin epsilon and delta complex protein 1-like [Dendronephthya gigantea]|uniref:tubulin epsilon and delta complex protein 1-like n=1 Tax=Dendronephthya gigantea TaxID=151771 RepID=UPI0010697AAB|nr:tubulin epsilon and delta complex protein 1-like [Dendronephthya gigantea]
MASKQHIKEVINALCRIILHNGGTKIAPETFRLAKFGKNEVTGVMWKLLYETVWFVKFNTFRTTEKFKDENMQDAILWTKYELYARGYYIQNFYELPNDISSGSREILLAFGWLVSKSKLLNSLLDNCNNIFEECLPTEWESLIASHKSHSEKSDKFSRNLELETDKCTDFNQLSWILGNLMLSFKGLFSAENQLASLLAKVHSATQGVATPKGHLSALEVFLLRHPKELSKFLEKTIQYNEYLGNLLTFTEMQDIFWKWLESVYEVKGLQHTGSESLMWNGERTCKKCREISERKLLSICRIQHEIQKVIDDNSKQCSISSEQAASDDMETVCQIKLEELNQKLDALCLGGKTRSKQAERQTFPELKHVGNTGNVKQPEKSSAQREIEVLKVKHLELELKLMELRNEHFDILNNLAGNIEDTVLIPPIGKNKYTELRNK